VPKEHRQQVWEDLHSGKVSERALEKSLKQTYMKASPAVAGVVSTIDKAVPEASILKSMKPEPEPDLNREDVIQKAVSQLAEYGIKEGTPEYDKAVAQIEQSAKSQIPKYGDTQIKQGEIKEPSYFEKVGTAFTEEIDQRQKTTEDARKLLKEGKISEQDFDRIATTGAATSFISAPAAAVQEAISPITKPLMEEVLLPYWEEAASPVLKTSISGMEAVTSPIQPVADKMIDPDKTIATKIDALETKYKTDPAFKTQVDSVLQLGEAGFDFADMITTFMIGKGLISKTVKEAPEVAAKGIELASTVKQEVPKAYKVIVDTLNENKLKKIDQAIDVGIEKGIKPSLTGSKKSIHGMEKWKSDARTAVYTIVDYKDTLKLTDEFGEAVMGTPQTLKQFSDAIAQTKKEIFKQYDALAKEAGESAFPYISLGPISNKLDDIINSKVLKTEKPDVVEYAKQRKALYEGVLYTPEEAQEAIKILNQSLDSFYRNPSYDTASKAYVDSLIANNLRKELDNTITSLTGTQYQELKNQYAALSAIEKDVVHRTLVDARKNSKGLLDFTDIFSGGEVVAGLISLNPSLIAKGAVQKGIKGYYSFINNPNTQIKKLFEKAEKARSGFKSGAIPPTTVEAKSIAKLKANKPQMIDEFLNKQGKYINTDDARKEFIDVGYQGYNSADVHEAASDLAKSSLSKLLESPNKGHFTIFAGGSGTGKTSSIKNIISNLEARSAAILDGNLSSYEKAKALIKQGEKAGKTAQIVYVYRDIVDSFENGVLKRMLSNPEEMRRIVPINIHIQNHIGSLDTIKQIVKNKDASYVLIDNSLGKGAQTLMNTKKLFSIKYASKKDLRTELEKLINNAYAQGKITAKEREAYLQ